MCFFVDSGGGVMRAVLIVVWVLGRSCFVTDARNQLQVVGHVTSIIEGVEYLDTYL